MATFKVGTVTVTNGSNVVVGSGVDWTTVPVGSIFTFALSPNPFFVQSKALVSGVWSLTLSANITGLVTSPSAGISYQINSDFSNIYAFVLQNYGDGRADLFQRQFIAKLEQVLLTIAGGGGGGGAGYFVVKKTIMGLDIGRSTIAITFSTPLATAPMSIGTPIFEKPYPYSDDIDVVSIDSLTQFGFNVKLGAPAKVNYILHCQVYVSAGILKTVT